MIARFLEVGDMLASEIHRFLKAYTPASQTTRIYALTIGDLETDGYTADAINLRVFVIPDVPKAAIETRSKDTFSFPYTIVFFEKCQTATAGAPPNSWVDARTLIVDAVIREFGDLRKEKLPESLHALRCQESEYAVFVDESMLREQGAFWSEISLTYSECVRV